MAVKTEIWIKAHMRRCFNAGLTCAVVRRGAAEAGTVIFVVSSSPDAHWVYMPAPGPTYDESGVRRFVVRNAAAQPMSAGEVQSFVDRQLSFDPDSWVIDIDDPSGCGLLERDMRTEQPDV